MFLVFAQGVTENEVSKLRGGVFGSPESALYIFTSPSTLENPVDLLLGMHSLSRVSLDRATRWRLQALTFGVL